jgi:hypothetical protein
MAVMQVLYVGRECRDEKSGVIVGRREMWKKRAL